ncbi:hypothetical protein QR680_004280 [Steinernema hermaphroditum]|uniref:Uncharacterized protein n=1 Tax=Steinernema hermaphroditum TaxID=289476 RepID=A0AA39HPA0_9BILA|nr:hypothetical protein QR680_004280 [Steinernema hermaphroditum]
MSESAVFEHVLGDINGVISMIMPIPFLIVISLVLYLSLRKVKPSLARTYTLNLSIPGIGYSIYLIVSYVLYKLNLCEHCTVRGVGEGSFADVVVDLTYYFCTYEYRMLAIMIIVLTYISFAKPSWYSKISGRREIWTIFGTGHTVALLLSFAGMSTPNRGTMKYVLDDTLAATAPSVSAVEIVTSVVNAGTFIVILIFYITSIKEILVFNYRNAKLHRAVSQKRLRMKAQLYATLAYITPPTIVLIPNSICVNLVVAYLKHDVIVIDQICEVKIRLHSCLLSMRLFLACAMVLIAFGDYRRAFCKMVGNVVHFVRNKKVDSSSVVVVENFRSTT